LNFIITFEKFHIENFTNILRQPKCSMWTDGQTDVT